MDNISVDHLLGIKFLNQQDLELIFQTADNFKEVINRPIKKVPSLRDITIANLFFENSTRTKLSFELAEKRLSADVLNFSSTQSSLKKGESLLDTVNNILSMKVDMIVIRHSNAGVPQLLSEKVNATIINAGDGAHEHPTQALLDSYSMRQKIGNLKNKNILICMDVGSTPDKKNSENYQSGPLSFEIISNKKKLISNCGYYKQDNHKLNHLSKTTAAQSTLVIDDNSSCKFFWINKSWLVKKGLRIITNG